MTLTLVPRLSGSGRLVLLGGGEFSFGETLEADRLWIERTPPGAVGFLPAASGSDDYGRHFATYLVETFDRQATTIPIYRERDARRQKNAARIRNCAAVYVGAGISDALVATLHDAPALDALEELVCSGGTVVAIGAAAQAAGTWIRRLGGEGSAPGLGWLEGTVVEPNFLPNHDRRLRALMREAGVERGIGLPAGSCLMLSGSGGGELLGAAFALEEADGDLKVLTVGTDSGV